MSLGLGEEEEGGGSAAVWLLCDHPVSRGRKEDIGLVREKVWEGLV